MEKSLFAAGLAFVELGGVSPNPKVSLVRKGIALAEREGIDFVLAVGGGSVIDSAKAIAMGVATKTDPWQFASTGTKPDTTLPVGTVLTLAASGSESSNSCVLTNEETKEKRGITSETNRPRISFLDPENTYTVSKFQTGCGIVDIMMHTLERYLTPGRRRKRHYRPHCRGSAHCRARCRPAGNRQSARLRSPRFPDVGGQRFT